MPDKNSLIEQLNNINEKISKIYKENYPFDAATKLEIDRLYLEYCKIENYLQMMDYNFVIGNDIVDLYKKDTDYFEGDYIICLHNTLTKIGEIDYRPGEWYMGNIGYKIYEKYRGNNYAYYATYLLLNILALNGINEATIAVKMENIASTKIMDKLKELGLECVVEEDKEDNNVLRYHYKFNKEMFYNNRQK